MYHHLNTTLNQLAASFLLSLPLLFQVEKINLRVSKQVNHDKTVIKQEPKIQKHQGKTCSADYSVGWYLLLADESDAKVSVRTQSAYQIPKLGRKDLHPGKDEVNQDEKHEEEEEDEIIVEDEDKHENKEGKVHETEEKEDEKHVARGGEEQEEDENKNEELEDERGVGDDEIDENDQEKPGVDADHDEDFIDEEKEKEKAEEGDEKENENSEDEEKEGSVENHNSHEAREEHYKADDASSAVTHDTHTTSTEIEKVILENSGVNSEMGITKSENKPNHTEEIITIRNQPSSYFNITEVKLTGETYSNATSGNETGNSSLSNKVDSSHLNNTALTYSNSHSETTSNLTLVFPGANNNMTKMVTFSNQAQNDTVNSVVTGDAKNVQTEGFEQGGNGISEENLPGSNLTVTVKTENGAAAGGESSNLEGGDIESTRRFVASNETENKGNTEMGETNKTQNNSYTKDNTNATKDGESKGDTQTSKTSDSSSANGTSDSVEHHATDSQILKSVTEVRTDLDTKPDIRNEADNNGEGTATD